MVAPSSLLSRDLQTLLPSFRKYWLPIALAVVFSVGTAVFEGFSIGMLVPFLQTFTEDGAAFRTGIEWVDAHLLGVGASKIGRMYRICGLILVSTLCRSALSYLASVYQVIGRARIVQDLRERVVNRLSEVALSHYATTRTGEVMNSVTNEVSRTARALTALFGFVAKGTLMGVYVALMIWISWKLSVIALSALLLLSIALKALLSRIQSSGEEITSANANFADRISEFVRGIRTITAYNMRAAERDRLHQAAERSAESVIHTSKQSRLIQPLSQGIASAVLILLVVVAVQHFVLTGALSMAFLLTFLFALFRMVPNVHAINHQRGTWAKNSAGLSNVASLIRAAGKPHLADGARTAPSLEEAIVFEDVSFAYQAEQTVLEDIDLRVEQGRTTALVGASGAGKSTLVDLIPRFYDPTEGRILYDGTDLRDFDLRSLRDRIAIVSQDTHIFNDTARANIAYGAPDATPAQVRYAAEQANALEFIGEMEDGFDTMLGERGVRVSGGQRQRIAIARALLQDPDLLILDEATSDLDSISERLVQQSLETLMQGRTVIAIAHRLSTIENADWIVVLEGGRVVEQGPYDVLLEKRGQLWKYHSVQFDDAQQEPI
ncbi:MAG: heterocyst formation ABC transporter subunit HepA [Salinibacter sp.]|uniref:heterocyst formation ABC transporter subunit HepA n=1 Tax=Salinibacter sp. TaxID=2065818 RepID=UPI0035D480B0